MMARALERMADPPRRVIARRALASAAAALAAVAATDGTAQLTGKLLVDGVAATALWSAAQLAAWLVRALRRAVAG